MAKTLNKQICYPVSENVCNSCANKDKCVEIADTAIAAWIAANHTPQTYHIHNGNPMTPSVGYVSKPYLLPVAGARKNLLLKGNTAIKFVNGSTIKVFNVIKDITLVTTSLLDTGTTLAAGKDYHVYACDDGANGLIKISLNASYPSGYNANNSKRIGGFHTLCVAVGANQVTGHPLLNFAAGDILPQSVNDLIHRPKNCDPFGMVYDPKTCIWVDIYLQSGNSTTTKSAYNIGVTYSRSWDQHQEDLYAVHKRMLTDAEFTSAAWGTLPFSAVTGATRPATNGGNLNLEGKRIISNIGCESMCGCYWQWINAGVAQQALSDGSSTDTNWTGWTGTVPDDQGTQFRRINAVIAGGSWGIAANSGARCRSANDSRSNVKSSISSRGASDSLSVL